MLRFDGDDEGQWSHCGTLTAQTAHQRPRKARLCLSPDSATSAGPTWCRMTSLPQVCS